MTEQSNEPPGGTGGDTVLHTGSDCGVVGAVGEVAETTRLLVQSTSVVPIVTGGDSDKKVPCEVYSRIVGYMRPLGEWNRAKRQEFADRVNFDISGPKYNMAHE